MSDEQEVVAEEVEAEEVEYIVLISQGGGRRILVPPLGAYVDVPSDGKLYMESSHPAYRWIIDEYVPNRQDAWLLGQPEKALVCPVCTARVGDQRALVTHTQEVHIDNGEEEETGKPRTRPSPVGAQRKARVRKAAEGG